MRKNIAFATTMIFLFIVVIMGVHHVHTEMRASPVKAVGQGPAREAPPDLFRVRAMSKTNQAYQAWARQLTLGKLNRFLEHVPFYGLKWPVSDSNITCSASIEPGGVEAFLHVYDGTNRTHVARFFDGALREVRSYEYDIQGSGQGKQFRRPYWQDQRPSVDQLALISNVTAYAAMAGYDTNRLDIVAVKVDEGQTVRMFTLKGLELDSAVIAMRFRRDPKGVETPTFWWNNARIPGLSDQVMLDKVALRERFLEKNSQ